MSGLERPVNCAVFAKHIAVADFGRAGVLRHVGVLRHAAQHGAFEHQVVSAQHCARFHGHTANQVTAVSQHNAGFDDTKWPNSNVGAKFCMRANDSKRVNRHRWVLSEMAR